MAFWKFDVTLLDLTGYFCNGAEIRLVDNNRLIARLEKYPNVLIEL
ncbi:MAG: hypothetical protein O7G87_16270 [bacterium]|nr:hypothetical protein [bacterium]